MNDVWLKDMSYVRFLWTVNSLGNQMAMNVVYDMQSNRCYDTTIAVPGAGG